QCCRLWSLARHGNDQHAFGARCCERCTGEPAKIPRLDRKAALACRPRRERCRVGTRVSGERLGEHGGSPASRVSVETAVGPTTRWRFGTRPISVIELQAKLDLPCVLRPGDGTECGRIYRRVG